MTESDECAYILTLIRYTIEVTLHILMLITMFHQRCYNIYMYFLQENKL